MTTNMTARALLGAFLTLLLCFVLGASVVACVGGGSTGGAGGQSMTTGTGGETHEDPHCLAGGTGGMGGGESAGYGCVRVAEFDNVCSGTALGPTGWNLAYRCTCLDGDCKTNGFPCVSYGSFMNGLCPECVAQQSPKDLGLGCTAALPFVGESPDSVSATEATFCCGPDHGARCVRDLSRDQTSANPVCTAGYGAADQPYFYDCLDDGQNGPFSDCVSTIGGFGTAGYCCPESSQ